MDSRNAVVVITDANWFAAAAFLAQRLLNLGPPLDTDIVLATTSAKDVQIARGFGLGCELFLLDEKLVNDLPLPAEPLTRASYLRIFLPSTLGDRYERIIYLDVDTYVHTGRLFDLLQLEMSGHAIAASRDLLISFGVGPVSVAERSETLKRAPDRYMNSGVLLIDLEKFRASRLEQTLVEWINRNPRSRHFDQSAFNAVLDGDWLELSPSFNVQGAVWNSFVRDVCEPIVVHFLGPIKPWHGPKFAEDHPVRKELERYVLASPWKGFLSQFYDLKQALDAVASGAPLGKRSVFSQNPRELERVAQFLRTTTFVDVAQGMTELKMDRIPLGHGR